MIGRIVYWSLIAIGGGYVTYVMGAALIQTVCGCLVP